MAMGVRRIATVLAISAGLMVGGLVVPVSAGAAPVDPPPTTSPDKPGNKTPGAKPGGPGKFPDPVATSTPPLLKPDSGVPPSADPSEGAGLVPVEQVDRATLDPKDLPAVGGDDVAKAAKDPKPKKIAPVLPAIGEGELAGADSPAVKAGEFVAVKVKERKGKDPLKVAISVRDEKDSIAMGAEKLTFTLDRADFGAEDETVDVEISYDSFRDAYGADYASRLQLVKLPSCQGEKKCTEPSEVLPFTNDVERGVVTGQVPLKALKKVIGGAGRGLRPMAGGTTSGFGLVGGPNSASGDFSATSLLRSASWSNSGNSGSFSWSYPFTPVPANGPTPQVGLGYSSQAVDGLTSDQNTQGGLLGPGWGMNGVSYIERSHRGCAGDGMTTTAAGGDLCWAGSGVGDEWAGWSINLNGHSSPLIQPNPTTFSLNFVLADDPLWKVTDEPTPDAWGQAGGNDGTDNDGEKFRVKTPDGWTYWFGSDPTNRQSVWAVPVVGNNAGESCYNVPATAPFAAKQCYQAWRLMLDKVVDPYGNTMVLTYKREINYYYSKLASNWLNYTRDGYLTRIDYGYAPGQTPGATDHGATAGPASMEFTYQRRCDPNPDPLSQAGPNTTCTTDPTKDSPPLSFP
jgi:hypothetical protein